MAIYSEATGRRPWIDFVTRKGVGFFPLSPEEVESGMKQFIMAAKALEKILSLSDDIFECCHAVFPDTDHWMWGETTRAAAADIWKYGEQS